MTPTLTDGQKLMLYGREVELMLTMQKKYFELSAKEKKGEATVTDVRDALAKSKAQESKVAKLTKKVLNPQTEIF